MRRSTARLALSLMLVSLAPSALAAFSFSEEEDKQKAAEGAKKGGGAAVSSACRESLKNRKVMVVVGQRTARGTDANQSTYGSHFGAINKRLKKFGFNTYTQEEITAQIAQAEIDAYFRNDPDAALNASKKMGADFILRGVISSRSAINPVLRIPEVYVSMGFTLTAADGKTISDASASADSYSGTDTLGMALILVNEQADGVVARLANDYCRHAAPAKGKSK
ncbi:MAG: hypothetical protein QG616_2254 [Pseudomonadota bacterium]|nr:hypothetical protein [Pseudomonadota bacterium]MDQ5882422.1 hypothetical protein [Pseudomonadota bacterium]MDQ5903042.1 hypothetical protein [Pseudomonadota bacterium]MDQ5906350.1 hypothetical protein [Pseudomonadota bacterium]MDQ5914962.1 hypothetical protein [Pseudomonadota bacterium]